MLGFMNTPFTYFYRISTLAPDTGYFSHYDSEKATGHGDIQPVEHEELHSLIQRTEGGLAIRDAIIIFTTESLNAGSLGFPSQSGSYVQHNGFDWLVVETEDYGVGEHVEAIAIRTDETVAYSQNVLFDTLTQAYTATPTEELRVLNPADPNLRLIDFANFVATLVKDLQKKNS